ncbi:hypothetical protein [Pacificibacter sp.]|uniref:hypothetical protein n=1 Tax=Pacificibacter sp. TaxID=1917866 RepID=UPI003218DF65
MEFMDWAWQRHHNEWSWYIRPLILIAFCMAAWHRRLVLTVVVAIFFPLSAVVFPAPSIPKDFVVEFLAAERDMLETMTSFQILLFSVLVVVFLAALAAAFWRRSLIWGLVVANLGGVIKLVFGFVVWGETGSTAVLPTLVTALIFNAAIGYFLWKRQGPVE